MELKEGLPGLLCSTPNSDLPKILQHRRNHKHHTCHRQQTPHCAYRYSGTPHCTRHTAALAATDAPYHIARTYQQHNALHALPPHPQATTRHMWNTRCDPVVLHGRARCGYTAAHCTARTHTAAQWRTYTPVTLTGQPALLAISLLPHHAAIPLKHKCLYIFSQEHTVRGADAHLRRHNHTINQVTPPWPHRSSRDVPETTYTRTSLLETYYGV